MPVGTELRGRWKLAWKCTFEDWRELSRNAEPATAM